MVILSTTLVISAAAVAGGILNDNIYNGIEIFLTFFILKHIYNISLKRTSK